MSTRGQPDRALGDPDEEQPPQRLHALANDMRQPVGDDQRDRHRRDGGRRKRVDHLLVDERRADADQLGGEDQGHRAGDAQLEARLATRPQQGRQASHDPCRRGLRALLRKCHELR